MIDAILVLRDEKQVEMFKRLLHSEKLKYSSIDEIISSSPLLHRWMESTKEQTDTPDEFLAASGLQLIASVMGNLSHIMFGSTKIFPHLWIILLGPSSFFRKTTALNLTKNCLRDLDLSVDWSDYKYEVRAEGENNKITVKPVIRSGEDLLAPTRFSIDSLIEELQDIPTMIMIQSEFGVLLTELDKTYNLGSKETLTDIYDSGSFVKSNKTVKKENNGQPIKVVDSALSIYSASTRDWLEMYIKQSDIGSGFMARFLFVPVNEKTRAHGWPNTRNEDMYKSIKRDVAAIRKTVRGEFDASAIKPFYELWYFDLMERAHKEETFSKTIGFDSRLAIYALKFAMIMHASKYGNTKLTLDSFISGIQLAEYFREKTNELFATTFLSEFDKNVRRLAEYIFRNDHGKTRRQLQQRAGSYEIKASEFKQIVEILEEDGDVYWDCDEKATISYASKYLKGVITT